MGSFLNQGPFSGPSDKGCRIIYCQRLQVCKWYLLWGLKSINRTYFGLIGALGIGDRKRDPNLEN